MCSHIRALLNELHTLRRRPEAAATTQAVQAGPSSEEAEGEGVDRSKGLLMVGLFSFLPIVKLRSLDPAVCCTMQDRFTKDLVVVAAQSKPKTGGYELQLPSMGSLTSKTSSQAFFLRILKVILQLRDAARLAAAKAKRKQSETPAPIASTSSAGAAAAASAAAEGLFPAPVGDFVVPGTSETAPAPPPAAATPSDAAEVPAPMEVCCL